MEIIINFGEIKNWETFHNVFSEHMGFTEFYGRNMDAWIDCMSYITSPEAGMSKITVGQNEDLDLLIKGLENAIKVCPEILESFFECTSIVNKRFEELKSSTRIKIIAL